MELEEIRMDSGSAVVDRKAIEKIISEACGKPRQLDPRVFNMEMCGSRLLVVRDVSPEEYTPTEGGPSIIIPETARIKDPPGAGWVIAVGEMVGAGTSPHPHGVRLECPSDLLYKRIVFGMWGGKEFRTDLRDGGFETSFWIMTDRDIWAIDNA